VPLDGLGAKLTLVHEFHRERGRDIRNGRYERRDDQDFVRWYFTDRADAEAFKLRFDGDLISTGLQRCAYDQLF
jgi:hypothetical protein